MQGTGPPEKMAENREDLTPMMSQYFELCAEFDESLVLFQVGDFYETFCEAAQISARLLEITLTKREDSSGSYPMSGIPIDNAASYIETLLDAGYRVAIADQVQDPSEASGVVDRAVTRVITPGTVLDAELLTDESNNYLACLTGPTDTDAGSSTHAVAFLDLSTGEFRVTSGNQTTVQDELDRLDPSEVITGPETGAFTIEGMKTTFREQAFDPDVAEERVGAYVPSPDAVLDSTAELRACGALLAYAEYTQDETTGGLDYITRITRYEPGAAMRLDATALEGLELFENRDGGDEHTLLGVLDETACALGRRALTHWLRRPLLDRMAIERRHDAVEELCDRSLLRDELRELLYDVYDIERLITRVSRGRANARDLRSLKSTLDVIPELKEVLADAERTPLVERREALDDLSDVRNRIGQAIRAEPPIEVTEGDVIQEGYDEELDALRATERDGREWVADLEAHERERTGIDSLNVGYNEVHGYYIEVTNPNLDRVPEEYTRRQTLKNAERFYTPKLKRREDEIIGAAERADELEYQLFTQIRSEIAEEAERVQHVASVLAELDVLATLAHVACERGYTRPTLIDDSDEIHIDAGRHPVVETTQPSFVPNDTDLTDGRIAVITGPNMSGKSTYMRQVALIVVLAQLGSFVPADEARLPVVDRVFTRVGASDDIAGGQSTFMREMTELSDILHDATERSLVLLDEVGRGTSTADGRAIAWAVTEFIHDEIDAMTLFATHYHDLTAIADRRPDVMNLHFTVDRSGEEMTFLHTVVPGASEASYGVEVARLAGVPEPVVERSQTLLAEGIPRQHQSHDTDTERIARSNGHERRSTVTETDNDSPVQTVTPGENGHGSEETRQRIESDIRELSIADMTPLEALTTLNDFQRRIDDGR
ncbi:DNA mismatch repair protein MutS [Halocatena pleomorpha]|uniref:DNA mismatch repair protein MutS n=1 Tax=Halocatena pleomorpha TaxID=1785090 RepID=A0A3P3RC02_9EURY|nr:DNA mismatch repair protein MutS [Halocatena pleomorpha]RRJ30996.1 DNA mismatch repair protein MutS [Halocatena pleomorpha]